MDETLEIFFAETDDLLRSAEESLLRLERNPKPGPDAEELFRSLHTLKSGSAMVGFAVMSRCAHLLENLLENVRSGKLPITKPLISFLLENLDFVRAMFDRCAAGQPEADAEEVKAFKAKISRFAAEEVPSKPRLRISPTAVSQPEADPATAAKVNLGKIEHYYEIILKFQKNMFEVGNDPLIVLRNLADLGEAVEITPDLSRMPRYEELVSDQLYIGWRVVLKTAAPMEYIEDVFMFVRDDNDIVITDISNRYREGVYVQEADAPLGEVLVEKAGVSREDVRYALEKQKKIGEILVDEGKLDKAILDQVISRQQQSREMYRKNSVRVDVQKIDRLMDLAEEIAVGLSRMQNILSKRRDYFASEIEHEMEILLKINH
ncbi:MAG: Hpt domain-containing protein, partial [Desulfobacterales bacterium]|nr:Hpt domain-containing protein [Desulfobacterales bacterium]